MDKKKFYNSIRPHVNLTTQNVMGMEKVLDYGMARGTPVNDFAYIIATAWWETGQTMQPVREAYYISSDFKKAEAWRKKNLRYYPWYGRGLIQTTWEDNYIRLASVLGLPKTTFTEDPDRLLQWEYALPALFVGMETGLYTGKKLDDYIDDVDESDAADKKEYMNARRIVNGTDKQETIANLALRFEKGLRSAGYTGDATGPIVVPTPPPPDIEPVTPPQGEVTKPSFITVAVVVGIIIIGAAVAYLAL